MTNRVFCKFFAHGACLKGEHCEFSHDWKDQANNVSTFYHKGVCSYGNCCRCDHVKASLSSFSSSNSHVNLSPDPIQVTQPSDDQIVPSGRDSALVSIIPFELSALSRPFFPDDESSWCELDSGDHHTSTFGKHCLHPPKCDDERDNERIKRCERNKERLEALRHSHEEIECGVCLDQVLSKATPAERKFGLLSECDHPFCISCIRNWRSSSPSSGMDVNGVLRACPICRKVSYYVIPSVIWYSTKEEKQEIVGSYKAKLSSIDCRYFDFGHGTCPFGSSCFYKHAYRDGRLEEVVPEHLDTEDGSTAIAEDTRVLSDFLTRLHL